MSDIMARMADRVKETSFSVAALRRISRRDALRAMAEQYRENLRDSIDTESESYWRLMLEVSDREMAALRGES